MHIKNLVLPMLLMVSIGASSETHNYKEWSQMAKKGPLEKRYVYDVMSHPMAVSEEDRLEDMREYDMKRAEELRKKRLANLQANDQMALKDEQAK